MKTYILAVPIVLVLVSSAAVAGYNATAGTRQLDDVAYHLTAFDGAGNMVWTTDGSRLTSEALDEAPWLADATLGASRILVGEDIGLATLVSPLVLGRQEGDVVRVGPIANPFAGEVVTLPSVYGTFNLSSSADRAPLEQELKATLAPGDRFFVDGFVNATVTSVTADRVYYDYDIPDGGRGLIGTSDLVVRSIHLDGGQRYLLKVDAQVGEAFKVPKRCKLGYLDFAPGTYRALEVRDEEIVWQYTPLRLEGAVAARVMPQEQLVLEIEIVDVNKLDGWGRRLKADIDGILASV